MDKLTSSKRLEWLLHQMGIWTYRDVIDHLPRRYENFNLSDTKTLEDKQRLVLLGEIVSIPKLNQGQKVKSVTFEFISKERKYFKVIAFNRPYLVKTLNVNEEYTLIGIYNRKNNTIDLINIVKGKIDEECSFRPIYSLPQDYPNHQFYTLVKKSLDELKGKIYSLVPYDYQRKYRLVSKETAMNYVHKPKNLEEIRQALRYLKYEEALMFSLKNKLIREENRELKKYKKEPIDITLCEDLIKSLPYELTEDQKKASEEIIEDMNQNSLMYRLLQGDVGSGKTLVSFIALYANYKRGDQGALMAPTDSLARQHYQNALEVFKGTKVRIALLVGATKQSEKERIYDELKDGYIDIVIGTHALFTKSVNYSSLGLVVIDEQHRFGVNQRIALASKGDSADMLMMSATPIPRSLASTIYADLDISTLTTFPSKKKDITTKIVESDDEIIFESVDKSLKENRQVYIVAPLIDFTEDGKYSVDSLFARFYPRYKEKVGLLHGKMKSDQKEEVLKKFYSNEVPILITTQVIEVGIDVKRANLMVIYDASNFGLASLHQLRGRIGRDGSPSLCLLTNDDIEENERLHILEESIDGFHIAEEDMRLRGPGELNGIKQSGLPAFAFLNIVDDYKIFLVARDDASVILKNQDNKGFKFITDMARKQIRLEDKNKA